VKNEEENNDVREDEGRTGRKEEIESVGEIRLYSPSNPGARRDHAKTEVAGVETGSDPSGRGTKLKS